MRFHILSNPHTYSPPGEQTCSFTNKCILFCSMMKSLGNEVFYYGGEGDIVDCTENIPVMSNEDRKRYWGNSWNDKYKLSSFVENEISWEEYNKKSIIELNKRLEKHDFICIIGGYNQKILADTFAGHIVVEFGIGYLGSFSKYRVFESYAWMHYTYGKEKLDRGNFFDDVIPNFLDIKNFPENPKNKDDYFLYVGRLTDAKGIDAAIATVQQIGSTLKIVGIGSYRPTCKNIEYLGSVTNSEKIDLMSRSRAVFVPTLYIGPFETVTIEANLSGSPVITTDWGSFTENIINGLNGYRIRTLGDMIYAANNVHKLDANKILKYSRDKFSSDIIKYSYDRYFKRLLTLWGDGWNTNYSPLEDINRNNIYGGLE
jgi:glycosyltransferase involved in cell wall biosynthesis